MNRPDATAGGEPQGGIQGKWIVLGLIVFCSVAAVGATLYRWATRPALVVELDEPATRGRAFTKLLRANGLWGLVRKCFADARVTSRGRPFLRLTLPDGTTCRAVRCVVEDEAGRPEPAVALFREDGVIADLVESAWLVVLHEVPGRVIAATLAAPPSQPPAVSVGIVGASGTPALHVRGALRVETVDGPFAADPARDGEDIGTFRYDAAAGCFRGDAGGPDKAWEVDPSRSSSYCP